MIESKELMLNNYIMKLGNVIKVIPESLKNTHVYMTMYDPILISSEWLLKFGFINYSRKIYKLDNFMVYLDERHDSVVADLYFNGHRLYPNLESIHKLQNLCYLLDEVELVNPDVI